MWGINHDLRSMRDMKHGELCTWFIQPTSRFLSSLPPKCVLSAHKQGCLERRFSPPRDTQTPNDDFPTNYCLTKPGIYTLNGSYRTGLQVMLSSTSFCLHRNLGFYYCQALASNSFPCLLSTVFHGERYISLNNGIKDKKMQKKFKEIFS